MKKKLVILDENAHWWAKEKLDWATQDKDGNWWIIPGSESPEKQRNKMKTASKKKQASRPVSADFYLLILLAGLLGISLALNVFHFML